MNKANPACSPEDLQNLFRPTSFGLLRTQVAQIPILRLKTPLLYLVGSLILFGSPVASAQVGFQNGTFDSPAIPSHVSVGNLWVPGDTSITGWTSALGYNGTYTGSVGYFAERSQDPGGHSVELGYYNGVNAIEQTFGIAPNQSYLVSFWLATDCCNGPPAVLRVSAGGASADYQAPPPTGDWFAMGWQQHSFMFTSDNTASTTLWFGNVSGIVAIDAITVSPVPEPSAWAVFGLGALALLMARRRGNGTAQRSGGLL